MSTQYGTCIAPTGATQTRYGEKPAYPAGLYELAPGVLAWMVPNGSWGEANAGLVVGEGQSLLIDTLWDVQTTQQMLAAMQPYTAQAPIQTLVNTHADGDHFFGNQLLPEADSLTSQASLAEMGHTKPQSMILLERIGKWLCLLPGRRQKQAGHWFQQMAAPYHFEEVVHTPARRTFQGETTLSIGGRQVQLIEVGPAHTRGDLLVYIPGARILFAADILFINSTPVMWAGPPANWLAALDKIDSLEADIIVPGHGPLTDKGGVAQVRAYWQFVEAQVRSRFAAGMGVYEAALDIVRSDAFQQSAFAGWNSPERMLTNVHFTYRHLHGRTNPVKVPELLGIMRRQALLAHELPAAAPACMRRR